MADVLTRQALQDWAESRNVMISFLGIRVSVDDAAVLGTSSLFVISLWLLLLMRRENHTVGFLLRDTDTPRDSDVGDQRRHMYSSGQRWLILHTIDANSLFVTFEPFADSGSLPQRFKPVGGPKCRCRRQGLAEPTGA